MFIHDSKYLLEIQSRTQLSASGLFWNFIQGKFTISGTLPCYCPVISHLEMFMFTASQVEVRGSLCTSSALINPGSVFVCFSHVKYPIFQCFKPCDCLSEVKILFCTAPLVSQNYFIQLSSLSFIEIWPAFHMKVYGVFYLRITQ